MTLSAWLIIALVAGSVAYLSMAGFVWANREAVGSRQLIAMLLAVKIWSLCYALELASHTVEVARWWAGLKYVGIVVLPPALWSFVLEYTGRGRLSRRTFGLLMIHPVVVLTLLAVPGTHDLIQTYDGQINYLFGSPVPNAGRLFLVHAVYVSALMLAAVFSLAARLARNAHPYRRQGALLVIASLVPCIGNALYNRNAFGTIIDPTPFLFLITGVVLVWGFFRLRGLDLTPVARGLVIEQMSDGVLVLDVFGRVADVNVAGAAIVGHSRSSTIGRRAVDLVPGLEPVLRRSEAAAGGRPEEDELVIASPPSGSREVAVSLTSVLDPMGRQIARLAVLRDVTERNRTERQVRELLQEQTLLSETLRQSLRPASLPAVPGLRLAARSIPSARGGGVGGDFYDVHPAGDGVSAFVLGDVSGKGVQAAVVTSMARYTVRTLSAQGWKPSQVLEQLNRALLTPEDGERFCTVVYGQVLPIPDAGLVDAGLVDGGLVDGGLVDGGLVDGGTARRSGVRLVVSLGGHPPPLLRRRAGGVRFVGEHGTVLGVLPTIEVHEVVVDLCSGDVLLAYTDGVTEARCGAAEFGEDRLADVLAAVDVEALLRPGLPGEPAARLASAVADAVLVAVESFASERDDVALLVLAAC